MKICVTESHIQNGIERESHRCMIADAIKDAVPVAQYILVDLQSIRWSDPVKKKRYTYFTPSIAQRNLLRFDHGDKAIKPFTFSLTDPKTRVMGWEGQQPGGRAGQTRKGKKVKRRSKAHKAKYAYLAANRELGKQKEREFGLRKFAR